MEVDSRVQDLLQEDSQEQGSREDFQGQDLPLVGYKQPEPQVPQQMAHPSA